VLYGHIHRNREDQRGPIHSFCTASASSIGNASFRIIDLEKEERAWHCRVRLMSLDQSSSASHTFKLVTESAWQTE
jgi:hypothetical protein